MKTFITASLVMANLALADSLVGEIALVDFSEDEIAALDAGYVDEEDLLSGKSSSEITFVPQPLSETNEKAEKVPGKWTDEQKLTLETFKEVVAADIENVWVVAYIDPRCRDCLILSVEWEKLTQIEEREKRKIKLGYVDISVEENWKIIQDHTKGKKMTSTPAVTLYGENKESPYWYPQDQPDAKGVHTWVSSYADHFGYGYWNPNQYNGSGVNGYAGQGSQYRTNGKYLAGDQVIQLSKDKHGAVMRRRTVATGGKLSGALHTPYKGYYNRPQHGYGNHHQGYGSHQQGYGSHQQGYGQQHGGYGGYGKAGYGGQYHQSGNHGRYGSYSGHNAYDRSQNGYGQNSRYGGYGQRGYQASPYGGYGQQSKYGGYGQNNQYGYGDRYGSSNQYGGQYGQHGSYSNAGKYGGRGYGQGHVSHNHFNGQGHGNALNGYTSQYAPAKSYNKGAQQSGYGSYGGYNNKNRVGSYGNPYQAYHGPGLQNLSKQPYDGYGSARYHEVLGKGVVLGKYSFTDGATYDVTDYNEEVIAGPDDKAYKEALAIAKASGYGQSDLNYGHDNYVDIDDVKNAEDIPDTYALKNAIDSVNAGKKEADYRPEYNGYDDIAALEGKDGFEY